jgi:hypothetical protein
MKAIYYTLITIITILNTQGAGLEHQSNRSPAPSDAGSCRTLNTIHSNASFSELQINDLDGLSFETLLRKYKSLHAKYISAANVANKAETSDNRLKKFISDQLITLSQVPGVLDQVSDRDSKTNTLRSGIKTLIKMNEELSKSSAEVETTIATLTARTAELEETIAQLQQKPVTSESGTDFSPEHQLVFSSPERLKRTAQDLATKTEELSVLKAENASLRSQQAASDLLAEEKSKKIAALNAENERLKAENAALKRAQQAADTAASRASASDVTTPLLSKDKKNGQGCPCTIS